LYDARAEQEVLVIYDELSERHQTIRSRAYLLYANAERIERRRPPHFVSPDRVKNLRALPIVVAGGPLPWPSNETLYALMATNGTSFSLCSAGKTMGSHELPVYDNGHVGAKRVLLTPVAVVADATIVGGFLFLWIWSEGGLNWVGQ
jgi:hypothetical protein